MSAAIAGPEIEPKTVNTKTDNATNFFMGVILSATSHLGMLSDFEHGGCAGDHRSLIFLIFLSEGLGQITSKPSSTSTLLQEQKITARGHRPP